MLTKRISAMKILFQKIVAIGLRKKISRSPKSMRRKGLAYGFTLIELLVASLIASFLVVVLLSFLVGVLDSDRKETAKSNAQEELQSTISYIADDLQEAIYIYGADALAGINSQLPHKQAGNECGDTNTCTPVLVFWKRYVYDPSSTGKYSSTGTSQVIGCMPYPDTSTSVPPSTTTSDCAPTGTVANKAANPYQTAYGRATYTNSLVAYYLKNDSADTSTTDTWSKTARILRWEIKDGYVAYCANGGAIGSTDCPVAAKTTSRPLSTNIFVAGSTTTYLADTNQYFILPSTGFSRVDFSGSGTLSTLASTWQKYSDFDFSKDPLVTLVDFMDDTEYLSTQGGNSEATGSGTTAAATSGIKIPVGKNKTIAGIPSTNPDCDDPSIGVGNVNPASATNTSGAVTQRIPADFSDAVTSNPSKLSSFYICVAPDSPTGSGGSAVVTGSTARIFLRGNAIARLSTPAINKDLRKPNSNNIAFFPTADVRSFGRSAIGIKKK